MADYNKLYQSRVVTAEEAVRQIQSGNRLFLTGNCSVPQKVLAALVDYAPELHDVEICQALTIGPADYVKPDMEGHLRVNTMFISANIRKAVQEGRADFTPVLLSEFTSAVQELALPLDVALVHLSPPDEHGFCSLGIEVGLTKTPAEIGQDHHRRSEPANAAHPGRFVHPCQPAELHRAGGLSDCPKCDGR